MLTNIFPPPQVDFSLLMPILTVVGTGLVVLLYELFVPRKNNTMLVILSLIGLFIAMAYSCQLWMIPKAETFDGSVLTDRLAVIANLILLSATGLTMLFADGYLRERRANFGEFYPMVLWATAGAMLMTSSTDLMVIFLGLETLSISLYVLAGLVRQDRKSEESAIKYFLLGAFASGFLLYGIAMIYGGTGTSQVTDIAFAWQRGGPDAHTMLIAGVALTLVGLGFKAALVPFHMWTPDVYQGAPTAVTAYMAAVAKTAALLTLIRLLWAATALQDVWMPVLTVLSILTMTIGNLLALVQTDVKRMLAYSSISNAGYMLVGILANDASSVVFYLVAYSMMTIGAFAVVGLTARQGQEGTTYADMRGLWKRAPFIATVMLVFMVSLAGIPPTAGFFGKWFLLRAALTNGLTPLAFVLAANSVISVYYYLRLTVAMYVEDELVERKAGLAITPGLVLATLVCAAGIIYVGLSAGSVSQLLSVPIGG